MIPKGSKNKTARNKAAGKIKTAGRERFSKLFSLNDSNKLVLRNCMECSKGPIQLLVNLLCCLYFVPNTDHCLSFFLGQTLIENSPVEEIIWFIQLHKINNKIIDQGNGVKI